MVKLPAEGVVAATAVRTGTAWTMRRGRAAREWLEIAGQQEATQEALAGEVLAFVARARRQNSRRKA